MNVLGLELHFHHTKFHFGPAWAWAMTIQLTANLAVMAMDHHGQFHHVAMMIIHSSRSVQGNAFGDNLFAALYQHRHSCTANVNASKVKVGRHCVASTNEFCCKM